MFGLDSPTSPTSPNSSHLTSDTAVPWYSILKKSYNRNFLYSDEPVYLSMSNIKRSGEVSLNFIQFQRFLEEDERFLVFHIALNDTLMGDVKSDPNARLCWSMPKSKDYFKLRGKFYIASSPLQVTRFPPPKPSGSQLSAIEFWENERQKQWKSLSKHVRATYTWPSRGDCPRAENASFACQSLDHYGSDDGSKLKVVHDIAMDNYCLLIYKVTEVEHFDYNSFPPSRNLFTFSVKENKWSTKELNP